MALAASSPAEDDPEGRRTLDAKRQQQEQLRAQTDQITRRIETMIRVLSHQQLDATEQNRILQETAATLKGLSHDQMTAVIDRLDEAAHAADKERSAGALDEAYTQHREIVAKMKELLSRYDSLRSLDDAAERLERESQAELELQLLSAHVLERLRREQAGEPSTLTDIAKVFETQRQPDTQMYIRQRMWGLLRALERLEPALTGEELLRARKVMTLAKEKTVEDRLLASTNQLREYTKLESQADQIDELTAAVADERKLVDELRRLASAARAQTDELSTLHDLDERLKRAIERQGSQHKAAERRNVEKAAAEQESAEQREAETQAEAARAKAREQAIADEAKLAETDDKAAKRMTNRRESAEQADKRQRKLQQEERRRQDAQIALEVRQAADDQARLAFDVGNISALAQTVAEKVAEHVADASEKMEPAEQALRRDEPQAAAAEQAAALRNLQTAREELARRIAEAELRRDDPLLATQRLAEALDKLVSEQKEERAKLAEKIEKQQGGLATLAGKERELAQRAQNLTFEPALLEPDARASIQEAAEAMRSATQNLADRKASNAAEQEDKALAALEKARDAAQEQLAQMEQRRDEIAALADAAEKLEALAKAESNLAKDAAQAKPTASEQNKELAGKQAELIPPTKQVGEQVKDIAPPAAEKMAQALQQMAAAEKQLDKNATPEAAEQAAAAAQSLAEARKSVLEALDARIGQEIADQASMQAGATNPQQTAEQIAKAIDQTQQAASQSQQSASQTPPAKSLAQLQQEVSQQAGKMELSAAKESAGAAASELQKGDLDEAVKEQQKALAQLEAAAEAQGQPKNGPQPASPSEAKNAAELAAAQRGLLAATQAAAASLAANQAAQEALGQAQAQAPQAVQPQLQMAGQMLTEAGKQLANGTPMPANQAQQAALSALGQAQQAIAAASAPMPGAPMPGAPQMAGTPMPGAAPGQPGSPGAPSSASAPSQERNDTKGEGNREPDGQLSNAASQLKNVAGRGSFLGLPPRERELARQAMRDQLSPEYAPFIRQYYINIARGKSAATTPAAP
jgi:hypothetical protein